MKLLPCSQGTLPSLRAWGPTATHQGACEHLATISFFTLHFYVTHRFSWIISSILPLLTTTRLIVFPQLIPQRSAGSFPASWICKQIVGNLDPLLVHMCLTGRPLFEREKNSRNITDIACVSLLCTFPGGPERCLVSSGSPFHYLGLNEWRMEHSSFFYTNPRHYDSDRRPQNESGFNRQDEVLVKKNALSWREGANIWCQVPFRFLKSLI